MTPSVGRLKTRSEFLKVAAARLKWVTPGLILQARRRAPGERVRPAEPARPEDETAEIARVGFTVSRKVGNAVRRNRARRRLRAAVAEVMPALGRPGFDYVVIGRHDTPDRPYGALIEDLRTALGRVSAGRSRGPGPGTARGRGAQRGRNGQRQ